MGSRVFGLRLWEAGLTLGEVVDSVGLDALIERILERLEAK